MTTQILQRHLLLLFPPEKWHIGITHTSYKSYNSTGDTEAPERSLIVFPRQLSWAEEINNCGEGNELVFLRMSVLCTWFVHDAGHKESQKTHRQKNPLSELQDPLTFFLSSSFSFFVNFLIGVTAFPFLSAITAKETWEWSRVLQKSWQNIWHHNIYNPKWKSHALSVWHHTC